MLHAVREGANRLRILCDDTDVFVLLVYWSCKANVEADVQLEKWDGAVLSINATALLALYSQNISPTLKRPCIEFGVVKIDSAIVVCIHSAKIQLLLIRRVSYCYPGGVIPEWMPSAYYLNSIQPHFKHGSIMLYSESVKRHHR